MDEKQPRQPRKQRWEVGGTATGPKFTDNWVYRKWTQDKENKEKETTADTSSLLILIRKLKESLNNKCRVNPWTAVGPTDIKEHELIAEADKLLREWDYLINPWDK
ncbi:MAG: hypothetical protein ACW99U_12705 [Candidatus Thorarchaeota archaeon]|jgi:hypothetical protein